MPKSQSRRSKKSLSRRSAEQTSPPQLSRVVPQLAPETLHALIRHQGVEGAADLVAAATPEQLRAVFDIDLWRRSGSDPQERFDDDRFGEWLEALIDADETMAARTVAALD